MSAELPSIHERGLRCHICGKDQVDLLMSAGQQKEKCAQKYCPMDDTKNRRKMVRRLVDRINNER